MKKLMEKNVYDNRSEVLNINPYFLSDIYLKRKYLMVKNIGMHNEQTTGIHELMTSLPGMLDTGLNISE